MRFHQTVIQWRRVVTQLSQHLKATPRYGPVPKRQRVMNAGFQCPFGHRKQHRLVEFSGSIVVCVLPLTLDGGAMLLRYGNTLRRRNMSTGVVTVPEKCLVGHCWPVSDEMDKSSKHIQVCTCNFPPVTIAIIQFNGRGWGGSCCLHSRMRIVRIAHTILISAPCRPEPLGRMSSFGMGFGTCYGGGVNFEVYNHLIMFQIAKLIQSALNLLIFYLRLIFDMIFLFGSDLDLEPSALKWSLLEANNI